MEKKGEFFFLEIIENENYIEKLIYLIYSYELSIWENIAENSFAYKINIH